MHPAGSSPRSRAQTYGESSPQRPVMLCKVVRPREVDPKMNAVHLHNAFLVRLHEHQGMPLELVCRERQVEYNISVVG